jgi:Zn-dependent oligopeptidase
MKQESLKMFNVADQVGNSKDETSMKNKTKKVSLISNMEERLKKLEEQLNEKNQIITELRSNSFQKEISKQIEEFKEQTKKEINELKDNPKITNQILQVLCISNNDNYLDMLTQQ